MKDRRAFIKKSATLAALSMGAAGAATAGILNPATPKPSRIRIAVQSSPEPTDVNLSFYKQMGLNDVVLWTGPDKARLPFDCSYTGAYWPDRRPGGGVQGQARPRTPFRVTA